MLNATSTVDNSHTAHAEYRLDDRHQLLPHNNNNDYKPNNHYQYHHQPTSAATVNNNSRLSHYDRASSESPETQRSYSASQKSDESEYVDLNAQRHSPENFPRDSTNTSKANANMLDHHKLPLSFLGPPLAALHSMTEMKTSNSGNSPNHLGNSMQQTQSPHSSHGSNPHGIDTILSRPTPVTTSGLSALTNGMLNKEIF